MRKKKEEIVEEQPKVKVCKKRGRKKKEEKVVVANDWLDTALELSKNWLDDSSKVQEPATDEVKEPEGKDLQSIKLMLFNIASEIKKSELNRKEEFKKLAKEVTPELKDINLLQRSLGKILTKIDERCRGTNQLLKELIKVTENNSNYLEALENINNSSRRILQDILDKKDFVVRGKIEVPDANIRVVTAVEKLAESQQEMVESLKETSNALATIKNDLVVLGKNQIAFHTRKQNGLPLFDRFRSVLK